MRKNGVLIFRLDSGRHMRRGEEKRGEERREGAMMGTFPRGVINSGSCT